MFEEEAKEYADREFGTIQNDEWENCVLDWRDGAEYGYNKANEWHYPSKGEYPKEDKDGNILVYHTSYGGHCEVGYYKVKDKSFMDSDIIAWKEIIPPKESE